jgi:hypothetical protein
LDFDAKNRLFKGSSTAHLWYAVSGPNCVPKVRSEEPHKQAVFVAENQLRTKGAQ